MVCHLDRDGMAAGRAGTPNYMAPEVWAYGTGPKYSSYGANADLWSAGMVLYELLTGHLPASHPDEYLRRSWCFTPRHIAFSAELRDLLGRLLMPRPRRRLQSCAELVAHPWFAGFDWQGLRDGTLLAPYVPAAHRPLPSTTAHVLASGASVTAGVGLMPPLLEENGPSGAAATGSSRGTGSYAAAAVRAIFRVPSAGALRQSAPAATVAGTVSTGTPTAPIKAAPDSTASVSGQPATELQPCQESSAGESVRRDQLPASPTLSPTAAAAGPLSVWRSLVWPAAARSLTAGTSAPASAASSTMSLSAAYVASPQGTWLRRGASYASVYVRDVCTAASTAGGGGGSFGFIGPALASVLSPVLASPKPPNITKVASAAAVASGSGMPGLNPEGVASIRVGSNVTAETMAVATEAIRTISGSLPPLARYGGGSDCARAAPAICSCVLSASETPTTSHGTSPFLLSTAAAATGTVSDCAPLRVDSGTFPAGSGSSGGVGGGRAHSNSGPCYTGNGGNVVWQATPADGSLMGSIELQPPTDPIPAAHTQGQRFSLQRYNSTSGEPSVCPTRRLSQLAADTGKPGPCNVPSVFSGPSFSSSPLAATARQPGLLSALASLQQHVQGLGPTGRRAGWWLQQRLADAATLAATLPDQLQFAAAAAAAVMGGKMGEKSEGFPTTAMDRLCKSESGASPRNAGAAAHSSTCVVRSVVTSGACAGDVMSGQRPSDAEGDCGNEDMEAESLLKARISGTIAPLQQLAPVTSSAEVCELAAATHSSHDNEAFDDSMPPADATGFASAPAGNVPTACHSGETPLDSYQLAASCWSTSGRRPSSGELSDEPHDSSRRASRPAVPPLLLSLPPSLPPSMGEVTRGGADAATVVRLICRSTDCNAANVDAGVNIMPGVCGRSPSGSGAIGGGNQGMGEKPLYLLRGGSAIGSYSTSDGVQECGAGAAVGAAIHATAGATPRSRNLLASPRLAAPRNPPFAHKRTGSFCFDPLDQARSASQPTAAPATPRPSTQPSTPGRSRVRGTSFSFDVGGLLSAGLLLGGSPALLADDAGATAGTTAGIDIPIRHAPADSCSKPHSFSVGAACANPTAAAAVALAAVADVAAATVSLGQPSPRSPRLPQPTSGEPGSVAARKGRGSPASPSPSACASANATAGPGSALRYRLQDPGAPSASGSGPVARSHNSSNAAQPHQLQAYHQWHQWQAGEAVVLLYAACVAVLVMAWAVILEGPADGF
ncbi:hypothetical protein Vretimale_17305 [Volvox reticuliferus]|nr:hypothetical protein Vretimale_17305 [Volvox reticuliferus]